MEEKKEIVFTYEQKDRLVKRIHKIRREQQLLDIRDIILKYNPSTNINENQSGSFMYFQNLRPETYIALDRYLKKLATEKLMSDRSEIMITAESADIADQVDGGGGDGDADNGDKITQKYTLNDADEPFQNNPKLKYSIKEKNIIKRKMYDDEINKMNGGESQQVKDVEATQVTKSEVFIKKSRTKKPVISESDMNMTLT
jgi:hypothetical protein